MNTLQVEIVTQEHEVFNGDAVEVILPTTTGQIAVLPGHKPLMSQLAAGSVAIKLVSGGEKTMVVSPGFIQVANNHVMVLADSAVRDEDLNEQAALAAKEAAEAAMQHEQSDTEIAITLGTIERAVMELQAIRKRRHAH